jgi:ribosomal protein S12 methylthiotransferase accessory factor YcaO
MTYRDDLVTVLDGSGLNVYPLSVPEGGSYPCVVYQTVSNREVRYHGGSAGNHPRIQLACWGKSLETAQTTAEAVKAVLDRNQTDFTLATRENEMDAKEVEPGYYRIILEYLIWELA